MRYFVRDFLRRLPRRSFSTNQINRNASAADGSPSPKPISEMPGPGGLPYFGPYFQYKSGKWPVDDYHNTLLEWYHKYGSLVREVRSGETVVHIFEPQHARAVFVSGGRVPYIKPLMETTQVYRSEREMSLGLGNTNGEPWLRLRSAVSPFLLRPERLADATLKTVEEVAKEAADWLGKLANVSDLEQRISLWQLESGARVVVGRRMGFFEEGEEGYRLYEGNRKVFQLTGRLKYSLPIFRYVPKLCPNFQTLSREEDVVFGTGQRWLDEAWKEFDTVIKADEAEAERKWPALYYLSQQENISKAERDIIALGMLFDGLSTTTPTYVTLLYCLAKNPDVQKKAAEEATAALELCNGVLNFDILASNLTYIRACIKETMRLYTITTDISRITQRDLVVGGYSLPAGTVVEINTHSLFRDKNFIPSPPDPETYAPERWMRVRGRRRRLPNPFLVLPFGHGARMCAGRRFAEMEMMALTVHLLSKYKLRWTGDQDLRQTYETLLYPKGNLSMSLKKIS